MFNHENLKPTLKKIVDKIASIDKESLKTILHKRKTNDITTFLMEMEVLAAGLQEAKKLLAVEFRNNRTKGVSTAVSIEKIEEIIISFVLMDVELDGRIVQGRSGWGEMEPEITFSKLPNNPKYLRNSFFFTGTFQNDDCKTDMALV